MKIVTMKILMGTMFFFTLFSAIKNTNLDYEDTPDFEFDDNFSVPKKKLTHNQNTSFDLDYSEFDDFFIDNKKKQNSSISLEIKKKILKSAILRALSTKELKQKFSEVLPLLRHLNKAQRLVFSTLVSSTRKSFSLDEVVLIKKAIDMC